tara:strand:+ start:487 stop:744 length:258 start_codon:yes stop_codon:yes gene_type:complete
MAFKDIFKKSNDYNEKTVIGFLAFVVMAITMVVDLITGWLGHNLKLNEFIFDAFMYITLGSFGIDGLEKFAPREKKNTPPTPPTE